jgi:thiamine biosynthesis protein ThiS
MKVGILNILIMAKIQLNGKKLELKKKHSILTLLKKYKMDSKKIAVELNGKIINRNKYKLTNVKDKDIIEIVHFIGGG